MDINQQNGYYLKEENNGVVYTYENKYSLSLGICYSDYMLREDYEKLNPFEKEDAILKTAVIDNIEDINNLKIDKKDDTKFNNKVVNKTIENKITSAYYQKDPEILLNLGYYEQAEGKIQLKFSTKGKYEFKELKVIAVPMNYYEENIKKLQENELKEVSYSNKEINGKLDLKQDSILQISTSYTTGWKAYVDGNEHL